MKNDDVAQKLALLPEGLVEENIKSWQHILEFFKLTISLPGASRWIPIFELVQKLSELEQAKLFRAGASLLTLMISTKEENGLEKGDVYIYVGLAVDDTAEIGYCATTRKNTEVFTCKNNEIMPLLLPLLDRLWNETRGKINA